MWSGRISVDLVECELSFKETRPNVGFSDQSLREPAIAGSISESLRC